MNDWPPHLKFRHTWRSEQQRVIRHILTYLDDKRLHLVAAPGAGKTLIGLEVFNQLQLKSLIISPTRLIRDQWLQRLEFFLPQDQKPSWCGTNLHTNQLLTSTTYQALFSLDQSIIEGKVDVDNNDAGIDDQRLYQCISEWFAQHEIGLLILDEAHHLKAAWQKVLMKFINNSPQLIVVSLTATPPYDANATQWSRYQQLCGPVDELISIPELVKSGSLCPHQDYIWMVKADQKLIDSLNNDEKSTTDFLHGLMNNDELIYLLSLHQWLYDDELDTKALLSHFDECFALLALHQSQNWPLPDKLLSIVEVAVDDLEPMNIFYWQVLLQSFVDGHHYPKAPAIDAFVETLTRLLRTKGFLVNRRVNFDKHDRKIKALGKSSHRIKACCDITQLEYQLRQDWMRLVILSDFIRDEALQLSLDGLQVSSGAYPIFHFLIHHLEVSVRPKVVLLTGRLIIVHHDVLASIADLLGDNELMTEDYSEQQDFVILKNSSAELAPILTQLHQTGEVLVIIGTRSLLGEGWDAPHVNGLIMATQTGAYVTTNQLRGRAIRTDANDELKTASIWHLVAVTEHNKHDHSIVDGLNRRFGTFAGLHAKHLRIESGIERLELLTESTDRSVSVEDNNAEMKKRLEDDLFNLQARWQNALGDADHQRLQTGLHITEIEEKSTDTLSRYLFTMDNHYQQKVLRVHRMLAGTVVVWLLLVAVIGGLGATAICVTLCGLLLFVKQNIINQAGIQVKPEYYAEKYAQIVLSSLHSLKLLQNTTVDAQQLSIHHTQQGDYRCVLSGVNRKDSDVFLNALRQMIEPIRRPRYIIVLNDKVSGVFAVPHVFGVNKKSAQVFFTHWQAHLPSHKKARLLSTASEQGRLLLLKAKASLYRSEEVDNMRLVDRWE